MKRKIYSCLFMSFLGIGVLLSQTIVEVGDNLIQIVSSAADGETIILKPGIHVANSNNIVISNKSLTIKGEEGGEKPKVYLQEIDVTGTDVDLYLEGIDFSGADVDSLTGVENLEDLPGDYLVNLTADHTSSNVISIKNCIVRNLNRSVLRGDRAEYTVDSIIVDDCIIHDLRGGGDYGPFRTKSRITFNAFIIKNSTFYEILNKLIDCQDIIPYDMDIRVENCTFYKWGGGKDAQYLFDIQDNNKADLRITSCILGKTNADTVTVNGFRIIPGAYSEMTNCAMTPDFTLTDSTYETVSWDKTKSNITDFDPEFEYPDTGNFTLPQGSPLLTASPNLTIIGDPRWAPKSTGINNNLNIKSLNLYPNPASNEVIIYNTEKFMVINFISSIGQVIRSIELKQGINKLNIADINPGLYFIVSESGNYVNKLIIK